MEEVFIFDTDEIWSDNYMIKAIGKEKIENSMDEKQLKTFIKNRTRELKKVKSNITNELQKIRDGRYILEDK